jgi:hypothetical protein
VVVAKSQEKEENKKIPLTRRSDLADHVIRAIEREDSTPTPAIPEKVYHANTGTKAPAGGEVWKFLSRGLGPDLGKIGQDQKTPEDPVA